MYDYLAVTDMFAVGIEVRGSYEQKYCIVQGIQSLLNETHLT